MISPWLSKKFSKLSPQLARCGQKSVSIYILLWKGFCAICCIHFDFCLTPVLHLGRASLVMLGLNGLTVNFGRKMPFLEHFRLPPHLKKVSSTYTAMLPNTKIVKDLCRSSSSFFHLTYRDTLYVAFQNF